MATSITCRVCGRPTPTLNLGVESCKACANFYKRSINFDRKYLCEEDDGICLERRRSRCRRCRFARCVAVGMKTSTPTNGKVLSRIGDAYNEADRKSMKREDEFFAELPPDHPTVSARNGKIFRLFRHEQMCDPSETVNFNILNMMNDAFPEFASLNDEDKRTVIKSSAGAFYIMRGFYLSEKYFPGNDRFVVVSSTCAMDIEHPELYVKSDEKAEHDRARMSKFYQHKTLKISRPVIREADLSEVEFHATIALALWNFDLATVPENILQIGERIRKEICDELNWYYKMELLLDDFASRVGKIMLLVHSTQESSSVLKEQLNVYRLYGVLKDDDVLAVLASES